MLRGGSTRKLATEKIYEVLRRDIVELRMAPGDPVDRGTLQRRFAASSTPVRDALTRLSGEGLVKIVPQSSTRISHIDIANAREVQFLRRALEQEAVVELCDAAERPIVDTLASILESQRAAIESRDITRFESLDLEFHRRIFDAAGVVALHDMVRRLSGHIDRIRRLHLPQAGRMQKVLADHVEILRCIADGDAQTARRSVRDHLSQSLAYSGILREQYPTYFK